MKTYLVKFSFVPGFVFEYEGSDLVEAESPEEAIDKLRRKYRGFELIDIHEV